MELPQRTGDAGLTRETAASSANSRLSTPTGSRLIRSVLIFALAGVGLYGIAAFAGDYRIVLSALSEFPGDTLALVAALVIVGWLLRGWRFVYYLRKSGENVPLGYALSAFLAGFALTGTPGKVGEAVKAVFLKRDYGVPVTKVVGILVVERLMDLFGVLLLGSFSLLLFKGWESLFLLCTGVVIAGGIFLCMERLYRPVLERLSRISFLSWACTKVLETLLAGKDLMTPRIFLVGLVVSAIAWGMESVSLYFIMKGLALSATLLQANFVYCFSTIVGALSMLPGGIGGTEAGMIGLLAFLGIGYASGLPAVILIRLCTLWAAVLVGSGFMIAMMVGIGRKKR
ncbi:MAG: lysylphosphatidylglycerol synthase transmembrane domain-containing protein [Desulfomonilaceae bacterium]|nr:lysylphosphatidylglycerol synthase transmembrane domain-containing protein [Desulfomonilaceae bacterium]